MNLDLAIQNQVIGRSFMADAMHGVASNLGDGHYRLNSFYESENEATSILGEGIGAYVPNPPSSYTRPPTSPPNMPEPESFSQVLQSGYTLSYDKASKTWALNQVTPTSGLSSLWASLTGQPTDKITPLVSKSGSNSMHRFLTTIQDMDLSMDMKSKITEICINKTDNTGISEFVGGQVITSAIDNPLQSDSFLYQQGSPLDILASEYVAPPILSTNKFEQYVAPPTMALSEQNIKFVGGNGRPF
jgi:hypothetical protein|tara:strand:- start:804 stop:1538 length:735 start_codon:yes stop_codon:yes gene_type:complete